MSQLQNNATALAATAELLRKAQAENSRLRTALEALANAADQIIDAPCDELADYGGVVRRLSATIDQARAALGSKP